MKLGSTTKSEPTAPEDVVYHDGNVLKDPWHQNSRVYIMTVVAYLGIVLFGYDTGVGGGVVSLPIFQDQFHFNSNEVTATQSANIQSNIVSVLQLGCFGGAMLGSPLLQKFGRKNTMFGACFVFLIGGILQTCATNSLGPIYAGRVVSGLGVGTLSLVCPLFVSECAPSNIRGRLTGMFQLIVTIGVAISYWISYGTNLHISGSAQWRLPLAFQLVPCGIMIMVLPFLRESPRWLIFAGRHEQALKNLAWVRKRSEDHPSVLAEIAEMTAAIEEEQHISKGFSLKKALAKGNRIRWVIAIFLFVFQNFGGQNSVNYYAPSKSIGLKGTSVGLLASGVYGIVKIVATSVYVVFGAEQIPRRYLLGGGATLMSVFLFIIGAIFLTHTPDPNSPSPTQSSIAMAAMIYCFVIPYCWSWGPVSWVYCSEIFPGGLRAYGVAVGACSQWICNFTITKITPTLVLKLPNGRMFIMFACFNIVAAVFAFSLPETKGLSLEEMDILFGAITKEERDRDIERQAQHLYGKNIEGFDDMKAENEHIENVKS